MEKRILILEDKAQTMETIENAVMDLSYKVRVIKTAAVKEAYQYAMEMTIDVFLVDIILNPGVMGDTSGIEFAKRIRCVSKYQFTPIIFITALADPELYAYRNIHCFGYLEKPFSPRRLRSLLDEALQFRAGPEKNKILYLRKDGILYSVRVKEIIYIQVRHHFMKIYLKKEILEIPYKTIKAFLDEADCADIVQCNRHTLINRMYIDNVDMINRYIRLRYVKDPVELGIAYCKAFKRSLYVKGNS